MVFREVAVGSRGGGVDQYALESGILASFRTPERLPTAAGAAAFAAALRRNGRRPELQMRRSLRWIRCPAP